MITLGLISFLELSVPGCLGTDRRKVALEFLRDLFGRRKNEHPADRPEDALFSRGLQLLYGLECQLSLSELALRHLQGTVTDAELFNSCQKISLVLTKLYRND